MRNQDTCARAAENTETSMARTVQLVKNGEAVGAVSAGNSGAMMVVSLFTLGRLKGVKRPALGGVMPSIGVRS